MADPVRVRIVSCPWPERMGCEGVVVADPGDGIYPFNKRGTGEVVILLDADPLGPGAHDWWTCVMDQADVEFLSG